MSTDDKRPGLTVIEGGKDAPHDAVQTERRVGRTALNEHGLTQKMEAFAHGLAEGLSNSEAYRRAYVPSETAKQSTVHVMACKMAANEKVRARVNALVAKKAERASYSSVRTGDRILTAIWKMAEDSDTPAAARVSALTLAAKMSGLLTDKVEVKSMPDKPEEIEAELAERLRKYAKPL